MKKMTLIATGDAFITRRFPEGGYEGFEQVRDVISQYDVKFSNLEMTFHNEEGYPAAFSGGTWAMADPRTLDDIDRLVLICLIRQIIIPVTTVMEAFLRRSGISKRET